MRRWPARGAWGRPWALEPRRGLVFPLRPQSAAARSMGLKYRLAAPTQPPASSFSRPARFQNHEKTDCCSPRDRQLAAGRLRPERQRAQGRRQCPGAGPQGRRRPGRQLPAHGFPRREQPDRRLRHRHGQGSQQAPGHGSRVQAHRLERQGSRAERQARRRAVERPDHHRRAQEEHQLHRALHGQPPDHRGRHGLAHQAQGRPGRQGRRRAGRQQRHRRHRQGSGRRQHQGSQEVRRQRHGPDGPGRRPPGRHRRGRSGGSLPDQQARR